MTFTELWERYAEALRVRGRRPATLVHYAKAWRKFVARAQHELGLAGPRAVLTAHLEHHGARLRAQPDLSPATARAQLRSVLQVFRWATRQGLLLLDPSADLVLKKAERPLPGLLSETDVRRLLAHVGGRRGVVGIRDRALMELLYGTGLRAGELAGLDLVDLDLPGLTLAVRRGKSRHERRVPLGEATREALAAYLEQARPRLANPTEAALFVTTRGGRLCAATASLLLARAGQRLELPHLTAHALRRAFASHMLANGAELATLKAFLGHADLRSTQAYTLLRPVELEAAYRASHPRARRRRRRGESL